MEKTPYSRPSLNIQEQIGLLRAKGLLITEPDVVKHWLTHIGYFRFKNYSYSFKDYQNADKSYISNTSFEMVRDLYAFDRQLRMIVFEALENIEVSVKVHLTNIMSDAYGPHWYLDHRHFISEEDRGRITRKLKTFNHQKFLSGIKHALSQTSEPLLLHYKNKYDSVYPPSWILMEIVTFGTLSLMIQNLKPCAEKTEIYKSFNLPKKLLISWLHGFSAIRNKCAHHNKLVYAQVRFAPLLPRKTNRKFLAEADKLDNTKLYVVLCCIQYMLTICNPDSLFKPNLIALTAKFPHIDLSKLGFTPHWKQEPLWTP